MCLIYCMLFFWMSPIPQEVAKPEEVIAPEFQTEKPLEEVGNQKPQESPSAQPEPSQNEDRVEGVAELEPQPGQTIQEPAAPSSMIPIVDYSIHARLIPESNKVLGNLELKYTNQSPDILADLMFHLFPNGFRNNGSAFFHGRHANTISNRWGYMDILSLKVDGLDLLKSANWPGAPNAPEDRTVLSVPLNAPLFPGQTAFIEIEFETQLPKAHDRMGHDGENFYFLAQWFPKIGVWETRGHRNRAEPGWNCHPFYPRPEFYANFGTYQVSIEAPSQYIIAATGTKIEETPSEDPTPYTRHVFKQDRVHDFAWAASTKVHYISRTFTPEEYITEAEIQAAMALHQLPREAVTLRPVVMKLFIPPELAHQADRHFEALSQAIKAYGLRYGPYPYETITMVSPTEEGSAVGGMEYPTLITLGSQVFSPKDDLDLEDLIVHEFGHQYWYGMVANNELEDSWLDEGLTTYSTAIIVDEIWGVRPLYISMAGFRYIMGFTIPGFNKDRMDSLSVPVSSLLGASGISQVEKRCESAEQDKGKDAIIRNAWEYHPYGYGSNSYSKPARALVQLEKELGKDVMDRVMRSWFTNWSFRHPSPKDFIKTVNQVSGRDMNWFFTQLFYKPGELDYKMGPVTSKKIDMGSGYHDGEDGRSILMEKAEDTPEAHTWHHNVVIEKRGNIQYPVDIQITFEDGVQETVTWDGSYPWKAFRFNHPSFIEKVEIDPEHRLVIDSNQFNNSYLATPNPKPAEKVFQRWLIRGQHLLQTLVGGL